jgi:UDP-N-acetyl-D-mannosaminuronate dehydrogenase
MKIAIVTLGYVGLPLAMQFERPNVTVVDLDVVQRSRPLRFGVPKCCVNST